MLFFILPWLIVIIHTVLISLHRLLSSLLLSTSLPLYLSVCLSIVLYQYSKLCRGNKANSKEKNAKSNWENKSLSDKSPDIIIVAFSRFSVLQRSGQKWKLCDKEEDEKDEGRNNKRLNIVETNKHYISNIGCIKSSNRVVMLRFSACKTFGRLQMLWVNQCVQMIYSPIYIDIILTVGVALPDNLIAW